MSPSPVFPQPLLPLPPRIFLYLSSIFLSPMRICLLPSVPVGWRSVVRPCGREVRAFCRPFPFVHCIIHVPPPPSPVGRQGHSMRGQRQPVAIRRALGLLNRPRGVRTMLSRLHSRHLLTLMQHTVLDAYDIALSTKTFSLSLWLLPRPFSISCILCSSGAPYYKLGRSFHG